jgi:hypothetical protein
MPKVAVDAEYVKFLELERGLSNAEQRVTQIDMVADAREKLEDAIVSYAEGAVAALEGNPLEVREPLDPVRAEVVADRLSDLRAAVDKARSIAETSA